LCESHELFFVFVSYRKDTGDQDEENGFERGKKVILPKSHKLDVQIPGVQPKKKAKEPAPEAEKDKGEEGEENKGR